MITIKQQAADGSMVPAQVPQGAALSKFHQGVQQAPPGVNNAQTLFKAQINVDRDKQKQIKNRNQNQMDNNLFELIKELHNQHNTVKPMNGIAQGVSLDPAMIDNYNQRMNHSP